MSLQLDLDIELGTTTVRIRSSSSSRLLTTLYLLCFLFLQDVSLANLFSPLWVIETPQPEVVLTPPLHRRQSFKRLVDSEKKGSLLKAHVISEAVHASLGHSYPWQSFKEHHSAKHVLLHYHPRCLDNYEYFIGRNTTTMTLNGYRVCSS